jgi:membrane protein DedA with SNARE-associated domain
MTSLIQHYGYAAVLVIVGLEAVGIPLPGETVLIAAALYAGDTHRLDIVVVILAAVIGGVIGDAGGFAIGYWGGYRLLVRYGRYIRLTEVRIKVARYLFLRYGGVVVFFGRFVAILRAYASFLAGTGRMNWARFLVFTSLGRIAWAGLWGTAAYLLGNEVNRVGRPLAIAFAAVAVLIIVAGIAVLRRQERRLEQAAEQAFPGPLGLN